MDPKLAKAIANAIVELAELASGVEKEDEHYEIVEIKVEQSAFNSEWVVWALVTHDGVSSWPYQYAIYIDKNTYHMETDGY